MTRSIRKMVFGTLAAFVAFAAMALCSPSQAQAAPRHGHGHHGGHHHGHHHHGHHHRGHHHHHHGHHHHHHGHHHHGYYSPAPRYYYDSYYPGPSIYLHRPGFQLRLGF